MMQNRLLRRFAQASLVACLSLFCTITPQAGAITAYPTPEAKAGSYGLEAVKKQPPPKVGATISVPGSGASFTTSPITVSGICLTDLLVQVYDNGVLAGSTVCKGGSFSLQISLFSGANDLTASVFDDLDQTGPASNTVTVNYNNTTFSAFGSIMTLSSNYGRRAANPGSELTWPLILSGGNGPYAFSIDWGDGTPAELKSQALAGGVTIAHTYKQSGVYSVLVKVTDANGVSAFMQLTAIATGTIAATSEAVGSTKVEYVNKVMWLPVIIGFVLLFPAYWLGRRSEIVTLHKQLQKRAEAYKEL